MSNFRQTKLSSWLTVTPPGVVATNNDPPRRGKMRQNLYLYPASNLLDFTSSFLPGYAVRRLRVTPGSPCMRWPLVPLVAPGA